ncbi:MAG: hypothetical protein PHH61_06495 [Candidatus Nanoarchaeia archaeon]|nr:hypothetical protein [Candidatus Nanoarchaeia archaeon]
MIFDDFKLLVNQLKQISFGSLCFGGIGEPSLHSQFVEALSYAKENLHVPLTLFTNGTALGAKKDTVLSCCSNIFLSLSEQENVNLNLHSKSALYQVKSLHNCSLGSQVYDERYPCLQAFTNLYVTNNLDVYGCCMGTVVKCLEENKSKLFLGNFKEDDWKTIKVNALKLQEDLKRNWLPNRCLSCDMWQKSPNLFINYGGQWI